MLNSIYTSFICIINNYYFFVFFVTPIERKFALYTCVFPNSQLKTNTQRIKTYWFCHCVSLLYTIPTHLCATKLLFRNYHKYSQGYHTWSKTYEVKEPTFYVHAVIICTRFELYCLSFENKFRFSFNFIHLISKYSFILFQGKWKTWQIEQEQIGQHVSHCSNC